MQIKEDLAAMLGAERVSDEPELLDRYSRDHSFVQSRRPQCVAFAETTAEVQKVVRYANEHHVPVTPRSSPVGFHGEGIPSLGGIALDLTRMKRILEIDPRDKKVKVEPGVTWAELQPELAKQGLMVCNPLLPHPQKSVLTSVMEREPMLIPKGEYADNLATAEVVLANGEVMWTGSALGGGMKGQKFAEATIPTSTRLFQGAQGTLGILTWATIKTEWRPVQDKLVFLPLSRIQDVAEPVYRLQRLMLGNECLVLNSFSMAAILAEAWPGDFEQLRQRLPPYTLVFCLSGPARHPEMKIAYEEEALLKVAQELGLQVLPTVAGLAGLSSRMVGMLRSAWPQDRDYWKFRYKKACHDVFFFTTLDRVAEFSQAIEAVAAAHGYPTTDIGFYLQPVERGRACVPEYGFSCNPDDAAESERVRRLVEAVGERVITMGGSFTRPYGPWADAVFSRAATYTYFSKVVKNAFDPNNIMNPGKLCF